MWTQFKVGDNTIQNFEVTKIEGIGIIRLVQFRSATIGFTRICLGRKYPISNNILFQIRYLLFPLVYVRTWTIHCVENIPGELSENRVTCFSMKLHPGSRNPSRKSVLDFVKWIFEEVKLIPRNRRGIPSEFNQNSPASI